MKKLFLTALLFLAAATPAFAQTAQQNPNAFCTAGQCTYTPLEPLPGLPTTFGPNSGSFAGLLANSFKLLLGAGATVAVVMLVIGALTYMFSDVVGSKTKALSRIRGAMWAIVLLVSSFLILNTINPDLVTFKLAFTPVSNTPLSPALISTSAAPLQSATQAGPVGSSLTIGAVGENSAATQSQYDAFKSWCNSKGGAVNGFTGGGNYSCQSVN